MILRGKIIESMRSRRNWRPPLPEKLLQLWHRNNNNLSEKIRSCTTNIFLTFLLCFHSFISFILQWRWPPDRLRHPRWGRYRRIWLDQQRKCERQRVGEICERYLRCQSIRQSAEAAGKICVSQHHTVLRVHRSHLCGHLGPFPGKVCELSRRHGLFISLFKLLRWCWRTFEARIFVLRSTHN